MTLEIPPDIPQWAVVAAAGEKFPLMDEDRMRALQVLLLQAKHASERVSSDFDHLVTELELCGESLAIAAAARAGREVRAAWGGLTMGLGSLASHVEKVAGDAEFTKATIITALSQLVAQVAIAVLFPPGAVAADLRAFGAARVAVREAIEWLIAKLGGRGLRLVVLAGAAQGGVPNLAAQLYMIEKGHQDGIGVGSLGISMLAGGVGGLAGHTVAQRLMPVLNRVDKRYVAQLPKEWLRKTARGGEVLVVIGAAGAAGGVAGTVAAGVVSEQGLSLNHLVSAAGGGLSGSMIGGAVHAFGPVRVVSAPHEVVEVNQVVHDVDRIAAVQMSKQAWGDAVVAQRAAAHQLRTAMAPAGTAIAATTTAVGVAVEVTHVQPAQVRASEAIAVANGSSVTRPGADGGWPVDSSEPSQRISTGAMSVGNAPGGVPAVSASHAEEFVSRVGDTEAGVLVEPRRPEPIAMGSGAAVAPHSAEVSPRADGSVGTGRPESIQTPNRAKLGAPGPAEMSGDRVGRDGDVRRDGHAAAEIFAPKVFAPETVRAVADLVTDPRTSTTASEATSVVTHPAAATAMALFGVTAGDQAAGDPARPPTVSDSPDDRVVSADTMPGSLELSDGEGSESQEKAPVGPTAGGDGQSNGGDDGIADRTIDVEGLNGKLTRTQERLQAAAQEILDEYHARSSDLVPATMRLNDVPEQVLEFGLRYGDEHDSLMAAIETVRRRSGKLLYREQLMGVLAMRDGLIPEMAPGSGKTLTAAVYNVWAAVHRGPTLLVTSSDPLAYEALVEYTAIFGESGVKFVRIDPDRPVPVSVPGEPTVYIATQDALGFAELRGHLDKITFEMATVDEIDAALFYLNPTYEISDGAVRPASKETAQAIVQARDFVADALAATTLTDADFGRDPALRRAPALLTDEAVAKARHLWEGPLTGEDVKRINAAAAVALGDFVEGDHFVMHEGRPVIIDQVSHKVMRDPRTATESRWHDIAPAIEAAIAKKYDAAGHEHTVVIHGNSETSMSTTLGEVLQRRVRSLTGTSGTVMNVAEAISTVYGTGAAVEIPRTKEHHLEHGGTIVVENQHEKQAALIDNIVDVARREGLPQLVLTHRNSDVATIAAGLRGVVPDESMDVVDAKWILDQGADWEDRLHEIVEKAGAPGKITLINMQGGRGNDYKVHEEVSRAGGMVAHLYGNSSISQDVDIQARNRVARNGQRGRVYEYVAVDDALFDRSGHPHARLVITQYRDAATAYRDNPSDQHRAALDDAGNEVLDLVPVLQQQSLHRLKTLFLPTNAAVSALGLGPEDSVAPSSAVPIQATTTPESAIVADPDPHQAGASGMHPFGRSNRAQPLQPAAQHTTGDAALDPASVERARHPGGSPETTAADIDALLRQPPATAELLRQAQQQTAMLGLAQVLQHSSTVWPITVHHSGAGGGLDSLDPSTVEPTDPRREAPSTDAAASHQPASDSLQHSGAPPPLSAGHLPRHTMTTDHWEHESGATALEPLVNEVNTVVGVTPWSHARERHPVPRPLRPTRMSTSTATPWSRQPPGRSTAEPATPWSATPARVAVPDGFRPQGLLRRQAVEVALWQAEQAGDRARVVELRAAAELFDQAGSPELVRLLDAAAEGGSPPTRLDTRSGLDEAACAVVAALNLRDLQRALNNEWDKAIPRALPGERRIDPVAWSFVLGGHGVDLPGGAVGHRLVEKFLFGLGDDELGPASAEQHGRVVVVMDKESADSAHTYVVVNWKGTLLVIDPARYERPFRFDPSRAGSVQAVRVVEFETDGRPAAPIVTEFDDEEVDGQAPRTAVDDYWRALPTERPDDVISHKDWMPAVAGTSDSTSGGAALPGSTPAWTFDELWQRHSEGVRAELARQYSDSALLDALVDEVRGLASGRLALRDNSTDPVAWLTGLASAVASEPVGWADRARRGLMAALPDAERAVLEPILVDATAAVLAHTVDGLRPGHRQVVNLLCRQPESLRQSGFDDEVVRDAVRTVAGAIAGSALVTPLTANIDQERAFADQTRKESDVLQRLRTGGTVSESERRLLAKALAKVRERLQGNEVLLRRAETYLLGPGARLVAGEPAIVSVPMQWLPAWFSESGSTGVVPDGPAVAVVSALRSAVQRLVHQEADYLRMRIAGLSAREVAAVMGLTDQTAWELHHVVMSKIATLLVQAALASDPDLLQRGALLWYAYEEDELLVEQIVSGERALPSAELEQFWKREQPVEDRRFQAVVSLLGEVCLAEWAPVVAVAKGVGPATTTALRALATRLSPMRVKLLRLMLWLSDEQLAPAGSDVSIGELVDMVFTHGQQAMLDSVMRDEYRVRLRRGYALMELPRIAAVPSVMTERPALPSRDREKGKTSDPSATPRPVPSGAVRSSGRGRIPWADRPAWSLPHPRSAHGPSEVRAVQEAATALAAGAPWESLSGSQISALVRGRPQDVLATDAPWPVRHAASMMLLVRAREKVWDGPAANLGIEAEQDAARRELDALGLRSLRVSETIAAWRALQGRVDQLGDPWRAWLVSYDPQTGAAVMAVTNTDDVPSDTVVVGHVVSEGPTLRNQFARVVGHLVDDARRVDANTPFCALASISDRIGADPFHGAVPARHAGTVHLTVHGVPEDADLPWHEQIAVAPAYPDQLRAAVVRHRWFEPDDPALGVCLNAVESVVDYLGHTGSTLWTVSGQQRMGHRTLTISGESATEVELVVQNHSDPVRGPAADDPGPSVAVAVPLIEGRYPAAAAAIAALVSGQSARLSLQQSLTELFAEHRPAHARVRVWTVGGEQRVQVTVPGVAEAISARESIVDDGATSPTSSPYQLVEAFAEASGLATAPVRFYWPVLPLLEELIRVMAGVPVDEPITAGQITDFAARLAKSHGDAVRGPQTVEHMLDAATDAQFYGLLEQGASRVVHTFELGAVMHLRQLYTEEIGGPGTLWNIVAAVPGNQDPREVMKRYWLVHHENNSRYWADGVAVGPVPVTLERLRTWEPSRELAAFDYWDTIEYVLRNYHRDEFPGVFDRRHRRWSPPYAMERIFTDDVEILGGVFGILKELGIGRGRMRTAVDLGGGSNLYPAMVLHLMLHKQDGVVVRLVYKGNQPELEYNWVLSDLDGDGLLRDTVPARGVAVVDTRRPWLKWPTTVVGAAKQHFGTVSETGLLRRALGSTVVPGDVFEFSPLGVLSPLGLVFAPRYDIGSDFYVIDSVFTHLGMYYAALLCEIDAVDQVLVSGWTINNGGGYASGNSWYANTRYNRSEREHFLRNHPRVLEVRTFEHTAAASFSENDEGLAVNVTTLRPRTLEPELDELTALRRRLVDLVSEAVPADLRGRIITENSAPHPITSREQRSKREIRNAELTIAGLPVDSLGELTAQLLEDTAGTVTRLRQAGVPAKPLTEITTALGQYRVASAHIFNLRREQIRENLNRQRDKVFGLLHAMSAEQASELANELLEGADQPDSQARPDPDPVYARLRELGIPQTVIDELSGAVAYHLGLAALAALADIQARAFADVQAAAQIIELPTGQENAP
ncbi:hypothetical protein AB0C34_28210 [Nocardia sp. NPDC049220]|uniref:hypothetical protein n=1 Tax=Nocardia sp. NPDC049220 TaxID=3155273 RepID=UPI0033E87691